MVDYLLDANHISPLIVVESGLRARVLRRLQFDDTFAIAVPALTETLYGIQMMPRAAQNMNEWRQLRNADKIIHAFEADDFPETHTNCST